MSRRNMTLFSFDTSGAGVSSQEESTQDEAVSSCHELARSSTLYSGTESNLDYHDSSGCLRNIIWVSGGLTASHVFHHNHRHQYLDESTQIVTATQTCSTSSSTSSTSSPSPSTCNNPPTVLDTTSCNPISGNVTFENDPANPDDDDTASGTFRQFYAGTGFEEDFRFNPSNTGPGGVNDYWGVYTYYDGTLCACDALRRCVDDTLHFQYYSLELVYLRSEEQYRCGSFRYDPRYSDGSTAASFNTTNPDVVVAYGFQADDPQ
ncbi:MAG: hypothetical protein Q9222_003112 [Ikaeria aurantiellina]